MNRRQTRFLWTTLLAAAGSAASLCGCTPDFYKASADAQVERIVRERKKEALGYEPDSTPLTTVPAAPSPRAYDFIPQSPLPPPAASPIEPEKVEVPYARLGPFLPAKEVAPINTPLPDVFGVRAAEERAADRLRLGPPAPGGEVVRLDLFRSIEYGVRHSRGYQTQSESLYLSALDVTLQRHLFDPRPFVNESLDFNGGQQDSGYQSALAATTSAGVTQQLPYGGSVTAQALVSFVNALNSTTQNGESASLAISGSIPLLRGAGLVNLEPLINSERSLVYAVRGFEEYRRTFAVDIASQYFGLLTVQQSVNNRRINYSQLADLTARTEALYLGGPAGRVTFLDVQRALQAQLQAEASLISAQETYAADVDQYKILLGLDVNRPLEVVPVELKVDVPDLDRRDVVKLALAYRLDLQTARDQVDDARRGVVVGENGLLPDLNLTANTNAGNEPGNPAVKLNERTNTYSAGITLGLPVDRVAERNAYRRSLIVLEQAMRHYTDAEQQVLADVRDASRRIRAAEINLQIQRRAIELANRRVDLANELLVQGTGSNRDVVDAETSLLSAQDSFEQARAALQIQVLQFLRRTGTLRLDPNAGALGLAMDRAEAKDIGGAAR